MIEMAKLILIVTIALWICREIVGQLRWEKKKKYSPIEKKHKETFKHLL